MANVAKINGYDVKDAEARGDIADIQQDLSTAQDDITTLQGDVSDTKADLGDITALTTTVKTNAVNAINEVNGKADDNADNIGTLASLTTTDKTDLVNAINEVDNHLKDISPSIPQGGVIKITSVSGSNAVAITTYTKVGIGDLINVIIDSGVVFSQEWWGSVSGLSSLGITNIQSIQGISGESRILARVCNNNNNTFYLDFVGDSGAVKDKLERITSNFATAFSEVKSYAVGDYVTYNNILYRCTTAHTAGVWVAGHFTQATVGGTLGDIVPSDANPTNKLVTESTIIKGKHYHGYVSVDNVTIDISELNISQYYTFEVVIHALYTEVNIINAKYIYNTTTLSSPQLSYTVYNATSYNPTITFTNDGSKLTNVTITANGQLNMVDINVSL